MKVTVVATEPVEVQVRVEDEGSGVNTRGLVMLGVAAGRGRQFSVAKNMKTSTMAYLICGLRGLLLSIKGSYVATV